MANRAGKPSLNIHFNAPSVRSDSWGQLRSVAARLARQSEESPEAQKVREKVESLLHLLEPMEAYWGFPGKQRFAKLAAMFRDRDYPGFHHAVAETSDLLDSGEYRRIAIEEALGFVGPNVHYFEVLVVGHMTDE